VRRSEISRFCATSDISRWWRTSQTTISVSARSSPKRGHTAAAIYAVQFVPGANGRIGTVNLRWQDPDSRRVQEISGTFNTWDLSSSFESAPTHFQLAVVASQFAELLRGSYWAEGVTYTDLRIWADRLAAQMNDADVHELASLIRQVNS